MKQIQKIYGPFWTGRVGLALFLLRLIVGVAFVMHGHDKIMNPFGWGNKMGIPPFFQALAALSEFGGGLALIVGFLTPLASAGIAVTMLVATFTVATKFHGVWIGSPPTPTYEISALYLVIAIAFILTGPGKISLDAVVFGRNSRD